MNKGLEPEGTDLPLNGTPLHSRGGRREEEGDADRPAEDAAGGASSRGGLCGAWVSQPSAPARAPRQTANEGGDHDPARLIPLCHTHHTAVHEGTLVIDGDTDHGFRFRHADGATYGQPLNPHAVELAKQAYDALHALGFKMTEARRLIDAVQRAGAPETLEAFVQAALRAS